MEFIDPKIKGKVVLITGANNPMGIGAATAEAFASLGAMVFLCYLRAPLDEASSEVDAPGLQLYRRQNAKNADEVLRLVKEKGGRGEALELDLSNPENIPAVFDAAETAFSTVDILVNNLTFCEEDSFESNGHNQEGEGEPHLSLLKLAPHFSSNTLSVALMMAEFAKRRGARKRRGGRVINVAADRGVICERSLSYKASVAAIRSLTRTAAREFGAYGITCNFVSPGAVQTGLFDAEQESQLTRTGAFQRVGEPRDLADIIVFLASEQARWLTGQSFSAGGIEDQS